MTDKKPTFRAIGVAHFSIPVSDLAKSIDFYVENVGLRFVSKIPPEGMAFLDANGVAVILVQHDKGNSTAGNPKVHHSFMVDHDQFDTVVEGLKARGIELVFEDLRTGTVNGPKVFLWDPDGHQIEILDRTSYRGHYL
ncbi:MAG: VOC family protein [Steroidobacteraceae bacterium]